MPFPIRAIRAIRGQIFFRLPEERPSLLKFSGPSLHRLNRQVPMAKVQGIFALPAPDSRDTIAQYDSVAPQNVQDAARRWLTNFQVFVLADPAVAIDKNAFDETEQDSSGKK